MTTDDLRILQSKPLLAPSILFEDLPLTEAAEGVVLRARSEISNIINGLNRRLVVIVGPCSIHDPDAALDYARRLKPVADRLQENLLIVLRVYFEKPRTVMGWKGLINDPDLDGSFQINKGLRLARELLLNVAEIGLPAATEFLDTTFGQYYADLISWGAIGARTVESQVHRELASGLSMPVGFKNRTDGDVRVAIDAIRAAREPHWFPSLTKEGSPAILETRGNPDAHLVLRGGSKTGANYGKEVIASVASALREFNLPSRVMVDCSHANSEKDPLQQIKVAESVSSQLDNGHIFGVMLESNLIGGRQNLESSHTLVYGQSITDACLSFDDTVMTLERLAT